MSRSTPGLPVHHQLPEFTQTHVHRVSDAIQPSHPLSSLLLLPPIPPSIRVFSNESTLHMRWPKYWSFSFSIIPYISIKYASLSCNGRTCISAYHHGFFFKKNIIMFPILYYEYESSTVKKAECRRIDAFELWC